MLEPVKNLKNVFYVDLENSNLDVIVNDLGLGLLHDEMENVKKAIQTLHLKTTITNKDLNIILTPSNA